MKEKIIRKIVFIPLAAFLLTGCAAIVEPSDQAELSRIIESSEKNDQAQGDLALTRHADAAMAVGDMAFKSGRYERALVNYITALTDAPTNVDVLRRIGVTHQRLRNTDAAELAFARIVSLEENDVHALEEFGLIRLRKGDTMRARTLLERVVALDTTRYRAHNGLGVLADQAGNHENARSHYNAALAIQPKAANVLSNFGYSRYLAGDLAGARSYLDQAVANLPAYAPGWRNLAMVQVAEADFAGALASLKRTQSHAEALNDLGYLCERAGHVAKARYYYREAVHASPSYYARANANVERLAAADGAVTGPVKRVPIVDAPEVADVEELPVANLERIEGIASGPGQEAAPQPVPNPNVSAKVLPAEPLISTPESRPIPIPNVTAHVESPVSIESKPVPMPDVTAEIQTVVVPAQVPEQNRDFETETIENLPIIESEPIPVAEVVVEPSVIVAEPVEKSPLESDVREIEDGQNNSVTGEVETGETRYWVYLPPYRNRVAAREAVKQLKVNGVRDTYIVSDGEYEHAVSLGVFSTPVRAQSIAERVSVFGFKARINERHVQKTSPEPAAIARSSKAKPIRSGASLKPGERLPLYHACKVGSAEVVARSKSSSGAEHVATLVPGANVKIISHDATWALISFRADDGATNWGYVPLTALDT